MTTGKASHREPWIPSADDPQLVDIARRLVAALDPERIYLFGSVARGDAGPDSDYDLLLIMPDDGPPEGELCDLAYRALRGTGIAADVVIWKHSAFERRKHVATSLPATVMREGVLLHAA